MNIPTATPITTESIYADSRFYQIEGLDGYFRRLKKARPGSVVAIHDANGMRTSHFLELTLTDSEGKAESKPVHAPGPNAKIEKTAEQENAA